MGTKTQNLNVGWLDLGDEDQRRAREYLAQFNTDNTLDELGFGVLRDAFADVFFPGTNTIMTRARYLVFIPALCLVVEREKLVRDAAEQRLTALENQLREALGSEEEHDIIGKVAKETLKRYPSSIYWNSLRRLGIFLQNSWGLGYYQDHLADFYESMKTSKDDDGLSHLNNSMHRNWDKGISDILADENSILIKEGKLPTSLNFALTRHEARYLRDKFKGLETQEGHPSIISHLLAQKYPDPFSYPWDVPSPASLANHVHHARYFSMLARGATLQYFHLLQCEQEARGIAQPACDFTEVFSSWWEATQKDLSSWQVEQFLTIATNIDGLRANDAAFIKSWLKLNVEAANAHELLENAEAHALIRKREKFTRPNKSRLFHPEYLKQWNSPDEAKIKSWLSNADSICYKLDYRASLGSTFVQDIVSAL